MLIYYDGVRGGGRGRMENDAESTAAPPRNVGSPEFTYYVIRRQRDGDGEVGLGFVNRFCGFFF